MALLSRPLQLHDVQDVEAHVWRTISSSTHVAGLRPHEREDLCAYLIGLAWELSIAYNPARGRVTFSSFLGTTARLRIIDWVRKERGRSKWTFSDGRVHERPPVRLVSLDADDSIRDRLERALSGVGVDGGEHRLADELRSLDRRARRPSGRDEDLGY